MRDRPASSFRSPPRGVFASAALHIRRSHLGTRHAKRLPPAASRVAPCGPLLTRHPPSRVRAPCGLGALSTRPVAAPPKAAVHLTKPRIVARCEDEYTSDYYTC